MIHINHLILIEEKFGSFEVCTRKDYNTTSMDLVLRFGYWKQVPAENLQSMLRSLAVDSSILVEENLVDDDPECGELYNYIITR